MNLLFFMRPERSTDDYDDYALYQRNPIMAEAEPGESVWIISRRQEGYALIQQMIVADKAKPPGDDHPEEFKLPCDREQTISFDPDRQLDFVKMVGPLGIQVSAKILGHSFRGLNAVRPLSEEVHRRLLAYSKILHTFIENYEYTRREIHDVVGGGSLRHFLPHKDGRVLCGAFIRQLSPDLPETILVGRDLKETTELFRRQGKQHPVPVFEKIAADRWKYLGDYWAKKLINDPGEVTRYAEEAGSKLTVVLKLEKSDQSATASIDEEQIIEAVETAIASGQGFRSDAATNKAIEDHAMAIAKKHFIDEGFTVTIKGKPYDLHCKKGRTELFVEVKGTQSAGVEVHLTPNEVAFAQANKDKMVLFIVSEVRVSDRSIASGGNRLILRPWNIDAGELKPMSFTYILPNESSAE